MRKKIRKPIYIIEELYERVRKRADKARRTISAEAEYEIEEYEKCKEVNEENDDTDKTHRDI